MKRRMAGIQIRWARQSTRQLGSALGASQRWKLTVGMSELSMSTGGVPMRYGMQGARCVVSDPRFRNVLKNMGSMLWPDAA